MEKLVSDTPDLHMYMYAYDSIFQLHDSDKSIRLNHVSQEGTYITDWLYFIIISMNIHQSNYIVIFSYEIIKSSCRCVYVLYEAKKKNVGLIGYF